VGLAYFALVLGLTMTMSFLSTVMFVSMGAFFSIVSDPAGGGTYMTLLNTLANVGGLWPKLIVMSLVDYFTVRKCVLERRQPGDLAKSRGLDDTIQCKSADGVGKCKELDGSCMVIRDGYYMVNTMCVLLGLYLARTVTLPLVCALERLPVRLWRVNLPLEL
jgi:hypothetical protein